jgi:HAD superfamily hydrolase (TIGR01509 family)
MSEPLGRGIAHLLGFPNKTSMLRAIIFDCDGVIADTEPLHLSIFQKVLAEEGIHITEEQYYHEYLAFDDRGCFTKAFAENSMPLSPERLNELISHKALYLEPVMQSSLRLFPGAAEFIRQAAGAYPMAIASGALRHEIELILKHGSLRDCFSVIVSAEDVANSKPHPEPFLKALSLLIAGSGESIAPSECLVVEDSIHGVRAARLAGMLCLAVTNSYSSEHLSEADMIVETLEDLPLDEVRSLF